MDIADLLCLALAARALLTAWFQEGGLFSRRRAYFEARGGLTGKLFTCLFCLTYHAVFLLTVVFVAPAAFLPGPWRLLCMLPVYSLAAVTLNHWIASTGDFYARHDTESRGGTNQAS